MMSLRKQLNTIKTRLEHVHTLRQHVNNELQKITVKDLQGQHIGPLSNIDRHLNEIATTASYLTLDTQYLAEHASAAMRCGSCFWWSPDKTACLNPEGPVQVKTNGKPNMSCNLWQCMEDLQNFIDFIGDDD